MVNKLALCLSESISLSFQWRNFQPGSNSIIITASCSLGTRVPRTKRKNLVHLCIIYFSLRLEGLGLMNIFIWSLYASVWEYASGACRFWFGVHCSNSHQDKMRNYFGGFISEWVVKKEGKPLTICRWTSLILYYLLGMRDNHLPKYWTV